MSKNFIDKALASYVRQTELNIHRLMRENKAQARAVIRRYACGRAEAGIWKQEASLNETKG